MSKQATVYLVDDDDLVLETLSFGLRKAGYITQSYSCSSDFMHEQIQTESACIVLDLNMPGRSGLQIQSELTARGIDIPIIIYSGKADVSSAVQAMHGGAVTLLQKPVDMQVLCEVIDTAITEHGKSRIQKEQVAQAQEKFARLSKREAMVASMVADGHSAAEIAAKLFISTRTVEAHKSNIFQKAEVNSVAQLTQIAMLAERDNV